MHPKQLQIVIIFIIIDTEDWNITYRLSVELFTRHIYLFEINLDFV